MYGGAPIVHCLSEAAPENVRWVSSQVAGDSTAQTVTIKSIGFMLNSLFLQAAIIQKRHSQGQSFNFLRMGDAHHALGFGAGAFRN
jgi:hypothetical protein